MKKFAVLLLATVLILGLASCDIETTLSELDLSQDIAATEKPVDTTVSYDNIYYDYQQNELRADDTYKNNRYRITAEINGMNSGGLFNSTGGATLTLEKRVGDTIVFFYAEFEKDQEDILKSINVGDTITFDGECLSAGSWINCKIVEE